MDPLGYFPYEIFTKIIQLAAYGVPSGPLPFLMTSNRWMTTILDTPAAWTYIRLDKDPEVYPRIATFLELSRGHAIDVYISWSIHSTEAFNTILKESSRIRTIHLKTTTVRDDTALYVHKGRIQYHTLDLLQVRLQDSLVFPRLEELAFERRDTARPSLLIASPNLQRVIGTLITSDNISHLSNSVKDLEFSFHEGANLNALSDLKTVFKFTSLRLSSTYMFHRDDDDFSPLFLKNNVDSLRHIHIINSELTIFIVKFLQYPPTRLQSLTISVPVNMMQYFASSISLFQELRTLSLAFIKNLSRKQDDSRRTAFLPFPQSPFRPSLRSFCLTDSVDIIGHSHLTNVVNGLVPYLPLHDVDTMELDLGTCSAMDLLKLNSLFRAASKLRALNFYSLPNEASALERIPVNTEGHVTLTNLEFLTAKSLNSLRFIRSPNLIEFRIDYDDFEEVYMELDSVTDRPNMLIFDEAFGRRLSRLEIDSDSFAQMTRSMQSNIMLGRMDETAEGYTCIPDGEDGALDQEKQDQKGSEGPKDVFEGWNSLRKIVWKTWMAPCASFTARFPSLTFIHLPGRSRIEDTSRNDTINSFCYLLWKDDNICPCLNTISSAMFPLWDLLFLTIHSRIRSRPPSELDSKLNASRVRSNITSLRLPGLPITAILRRLVDLLGGKIRDDIIGAGSVILERTREDRRSHAAPLCVACLSAGYTACPSASPTIPKAGKEDEDSHLTWDELMRSLNLEFSFSSISLNEDWEGLESLLAIFRRGYDGYAFSVSSSDLSTD